MKRFTNQQIKSLPSKKAPYLLSEPGGLYVRVHPSGKKTWLYVYSLDGQRKWHRLGEYPHTDLSDARAKLRDALKLRDRGKDPAEEKLKKKIERQQAPTVKELVQEYLQKHAEPKKKTWKEDKRCLEKDVVPAWGKRKAKDITKRDVNLVLESVVARGAPIQANNLFEKIRKMFNFAVAKGILEHSPCVGIEPPTKREPKDRHLSEKEIKTLWDGLDNAPMSDEIRRALKLILVTAQRPGEVIGLHSSEIEGRWWTIPAARSKNGKAHRVYLTNRALELIGKKEGFIFESPKGKKPIAVNALAFSLRRSFKIDEKTKKARLPMAHFTPHDLRRTAATFMASLGFGIVVEKVLNHTDRRVTAIYDRYGYDKEKRAALEAWGRKLTRIITSQKQAKVVHLGR